MSACLAACLSVCLCLIAGLTAAPINLIFGMHTHIRRDCAIGYMILTFKVIKGHFRSNKLLCLVLWHVLVFYKRRGEDPGTVVCAGVFHEKRRGSWNRGMCCCFPRGEDPGAVALL